MDVTTAMQAFVAGARGALLEPDRWQPSELAQQIALLDRAEQLPPAGQRLLLRLVCGPSRITLADALPVVEAVVDEHAAEPPTASAAVV